MLRTFILFTLFTGSIFALQLNNLLNDIKNDASVELQQERQRLQEFIQNEKEQQKLLNEAKTVLANENKRSIELKKTLDKNEELLASQEAILLEKTGDLGEMFGSVRQTSADFLTNYQHSLTASQGESKEALFEKFSNSKRLPNIEELKSLWHGMLDEIIKSGNVEKYSANVILNDGERVIQEVTRVGLFAAKSDGKYFNYSNDMKALVELATQPEESGSLFGSDENLFVIDPTRGTLFELLNNQPTLMQRVNQGGVVGYIIIALGLIGLIFAIYKSVVLNLYLSKIKAQMKDLANPKENNPLGKVIAVFKKYKDYDLSDLELKLAESILQETTKVQKGQSFVKLLSAVTPLLGLLGTVTGMIATFQAITLFGTGDPKLMAGGISTALITTVLGLVAAIPLLFTYTYISSKSEAIVSILEEQSMGMLAKSIK
ncbi:flagellar motor protein MotA [Halarcobacter ebronensis]|uniref:Flagellar motor protein MotA n=1 Tax=Halarcobacter ebronensis TaxID=1462615 RepID=A0A4Q0YGU0_9BACT|nr:MotA/TolQ/ExbB proton channel family protein [Halarcobacter ebronensis]RXJ68904.1 flagellar motor protein MotA [Halarcobacter ebronensis]